jgi:GR25 family glycosyltransferase involved in LPS biosynthesis
MEKCLFYCLSVNNEKRKKDMVEKCNILNIPMEFYEGVYFDDIRIKNRNMDENKKKTWSCAYGHFDMIKKFYYDTDKKYGIFCEEEILNNFDKLKLDILLLGYLISFKIDNSSYFKEVYKNNDNAYYTYPSDLWGTQMYMLSRNHAKYLLDVFSNNYADLTLMDSKITPFSADWLITKVGNKALLYPMMVIEDGKTTYTDNSQNNFHNNCHKFNYIENEFL